MNNHSLCIATLLLPVCMAVFVLVGSDAAAQNPARGAELYEACVPCHELTGKGVAGLTEAKLVEQMKKFQVIQSDKAKIQGMKRALDGMTEEDLRDLAAYISKM